MSNNIDLDQIEEEHMKMLKEKSQEGAGNGLKNDKSKAPYHLLPLDILEPLVRVYEFGTVKYYENSWREFDPTQQNFNRIYSALLRHLSEWQRRRIAGEKEVKDEESGLPTLAHVMWNAVMLMYLEQREKQD